MPGCTVAAGPHAQAYEALPCRRLTPAINRAACVVPQPIVLRDGKIRTGRSLRGVTPSSKLLVSRGLVWAAGAAGAVHAGFSLYWAFGGRWLLATVGQWAVDLSVERPLAAGITLGLVAAIKFLGAAVPVGLAYGRVPWPRLWRGISWAGGLLLVAYGGINTLFGLAVLAGVVRPEGGYDLDAMRGHAYLWDPLFFLWGSALVLSLWLSRRKLHAAAAPGSRSRQGPRISEVVLRPRTQPGGTRRTCLYHPVHGSGDAFDNPPG